MKIAGRPISQKDKPYVICEISGNHGGTLGRAFELIGAAKGVGADAVKFQCYSPDTITIDHDGPGFVLHGGPWKDRKLYDLYKEAHTPLSWFPKLFECAENYGITAFASVFDKSSVDLLESIDCPAYKIASFELTDIPLIQYVAQTGKPIILSTGLADAQEINEADDAIPPRVKRAFLHCISGYPTPIREMNLPKMTSLIHRMATPVGISDHTLGVVAPIAAVAAGACIVEKHMILRRSDGGPDAGFSLEPKEFKYMVECVKDAHSAFGLCAAASENDQRTLRRSLYAVKDIKAGELITEQNVRSIRPGYGLPPKFLPMVLGQKAASSIPRGTPLSLDLLGMGSGEAVLSSADAAK